MRYFIEPVIVGLNWATQSKSYSRIIMVGLSGGGWTTVVTSAIDTRIDASYPVAGSWPKYLRKRWPNHSSLGDLEQKLIGRVTPNYLELYIMATQPHRTQYQIFNKNDTCCFSAGWSTDYKDYVSRYSKKFGGTFKMFIDKSHVGHAISDKAMSVVLDAEEPQ